MSEARADVCVIGGGIIGLALALELRRRGLATHVLERSRIGRRAAAGVAAGMLAPVFEADIADPALTRLALASRDLYAQWVAGVEAEVGERVGYEPTGSLMVALHRDHQAQLEHLAAFQRDQGLRVSALGRAQLREMEPSLAANVVGGLWAEDDHQVDPRRLLHALTAALRGRGATVLEECVVRAVEPGDADYVVTFAQGGATGTLGARQVVLAAGAWCGEIAFPGAALPLRPVRGQILRLRGERLLGRVVRTPDVYLVPRADGELVIGATMEEQGFDLRPRTGDVLELLRAAAAVAPGVRELEFVECDVGFRPALRDHLPAIGPLKRPGLFVAAGHYRNGVLLAPITAVLLAELMLGGPSDPLLEPFAPQRFAPAGAAS